MISDLDLEKVARLARIRLSDGERAEARDALSRTLAMIDDLQQADVSGVDEMAHVQTQSLRCRPPQSEPGYAAEVIMRNAPAHKDNYFLVPKVIE